MAKKEEKIAAVVKTAVATAIKLLRVGKIEMGFNNMLDRYALANAKQDYSNDARVARAEKIRTSIEDMERKMKGAIDENTGKAVKSVANWGPLSDFFNRTLAHLTEESFANDAKIGAARDIAKSKLVVPTQEQKDVIIQYHTNKARANWDSVQSIRITLEYKGLLKKVAPKLPTEEEVNQMLAGQS